MAFVPCRYWPRSVPPGARYGADVNTGYAIRHGACLLSYPRILLSPAPSLQRQQPKQLHGQFRAGLRCHPMPSLFGERLRALRQAARLTQEELAERAGMTAAGISAIERGIRKRTYPRTVTALADALGLTGADREAFETLARRPWPRKQDQGQGAGLMLPTQLTTFIGRQHDRAQLRVMLEATRLVTLVGPGGIGKTRLAL